MVRMDKKDEDVDWSKLGGEYGCTLDSCKVVNPQRLEMDFQSHTIIEVWLLRHSTGGSPNGCWELMYSGAK
jgi:hypothetical protein